jgi:uncharacterized protein
MIKKAVAVILIVILASTLILGCRSTGSPTPSVYPSPSITVLPSAAPTSTPPIQPVSEDVSWNIDDTIVTATVTHPNQPGVYPAIVFIAGSGPTDRDWNSPLLPGTNGSARLLAEELTKKGFVTIRYDKRVTGPNAQKNMTLMVGKLSLESHIAEVAGAVNLLKGRIDVDQHRIYVFANSEGNIHALNYQLTREPKFAGMVLQGIPGRNLVAVMHTQIEAQVASLPNAQQIMDGYDKLMSDFLAGKPFAADPALPEGINTLIQGFYAPINLPFTRELFPFDTAPLLPKITVPTLVMIGKKDIQIDYQLDGVPLENAAKGLSNFTFVYPENTNHVLKLETKPRNEITAVDVLNYNAADRVPDPDAVTVIEDWLAKQK